MWVLLNSFKTDLLHNGGLLIYSFICMIIRLSDLVTRSQKCLLYTQRSSAANSLTNRGGQRKGKIKEDVSMQMTQEGITIQRYKIIKLFYISCHLAWFFNKSRCVKIREGGE